MKDKNLKLFFLITLFSCLFDQISKYFIIQILNSEIKIFNFFSLTIVKNYGIIFGLLNIKKLKGLVILFSFIALVSICFYVKIKSEYKIALGLIEGGIAGNLIDRIKNGYVIDFINFHFWPVFNFADIFIVIGIFLLFIMQIKGEKCIQCF